MTKLIVTFVISVLKKKSRQVLRKHVKGEPLLALCGGMKNRDNIPEQVAFVEK